MAEFELVPKVIMIFILYTLWNVVSNLSLQTQIEIMVKRFPSPPTAMIRQMLIMATVL